MRVDSGVVAIADIYLQCTGEPLQGSGDELRGWCPDIGHGDKGTPSAQYNVAKNVWHCHTCGAGGGYIDYILSKGIAESRPSARKWLEEQGYRIAPQTTGNWWSRVEQTYTYTDATGHPVYQVGRIGHGAQKQIRQRKFERVALDGSLEWNENRRCLEGIPRVLYRLPHVLETAALGGVIYVVEGEKDADNLFRAGLCATTTAEGARLAWLPEHAESFRGAGTVVVIADNDDPGVKCARRRAAQIAHYVPRTYCIEALPGVDKKGDVTDWLELGNDPSQLLSIATALPPATPEAPLEPDADLLELTDDLSEMGLLRWFQRCAAGRMYYVREWGAWIAWEDGRWSTLGNVGRILHDAWEELSRRAKEYDGPYAAELQKFVKRTRTHRAQQNVLKLAEAHMDIRASSLDDQPHLLNVQNGTIDLETCELRPHSADDLLTLKTAVAYDPEAGCPRFHEFLLAAVGGDLELYHYIQCLAGGSLEGRIGTRKLYFIFGPGGTGKSTVVRCFTEALGEYSISVDMTALCEQRVNSAAPSPELVRLKGKRLVTAAETSANHRLSDAKIKQLIGGDIVVARDLHKSPIEFRVQATLVFFGNSRPAVEADESFWSKLKQIGFLHPIPSSAANERFFEDVLRPELPGILTWMVEGLRKLKRAQYRLPDPQSVALATDTYRESARVLDDFLSECCVKERTAIIGATDLYDAYLEWVGRGKPVSPRTFSKAMRTENDITETRLHARRAWQGIRLSIEGANKRLAAAPRHDEELIDF